MMATAASSPILHLIRRLAEDRSVRDLSDSELLQRFFSHQDEAAFHSLLRRHGAMVLDVCRSVLRREADAEDAFQASFLVLVRKGQSIRKTASLGCWLHGVAYRTALKALDQSCKRQKNESRIPARQASELDDPSWREVRQVLHEEVSKLPERYRAALVLCYLEGRTQDVSAATLGIPKGTLRERLERGSALLRTRLVRRGLGPAAIVAAAAFPAAEVSASVSKTLIASTIKAASCLAAGQTASGLISTNVAVLIEGVNKMKATTLLVLLGAMTFGVVYGVMAGNQQVAAQPAKYNQEALPAGKATTGALKTKAWGEEKGDNVAVSGRVLDPDGKPLAGAKLYVWVRDNNLKAVESKVRATTDRDGRFDFTFAKKDIAAVGQWNWRPDPWRYAVIVAAAPGYGAGWKPIANWEAGSMRLETGESELQLVKDDMPVRGRVRDLEGRPVPGATVRVKNIDSLYGCAWEGLSGKVTTDKDGHFTITGIGRGRAVSLVVTGPAIQMLKADIKTSTVAGNPPLDFIAEPAKPIEGVVLARDTGKPLAGVVVFGKHTGFDDINPDPFGELTTVTDSEGRYRLVGLPKASQYEVRVSPSADQSYLETVKRVGDTEGLKPIKLDFDLRRGVTVRFRVIDKVTRQSAPAIAQYTPAATNPLWLEACGPGPERAILPRCFMDVHVADQDGYFQFVVYPGHGAIFVNTTDRERYTQGQLDPADEKKGYYPLSKDEPNNGFVHGNGYRVVDTQNTDKPLTFDVEVTPHQSPLKK